MMRNRESIIENIIERNNIVIVALNIETKNWIGIKKNRMHIDRRMENELSILANLIINVNEKPIISIFNTFFIGPYGHNKQ